MNHLIDLPAAAMQIIAAERILVIGNPGSGKSTFAQQLAGLKRIPYRSMDRDFFWLPGWKLRERSEIRLLIEQAVGDPRWIMDGNSPGTLPLRLPRTDLVIWRRPSIGSSLAGVFRRWWKFRGRSRPEMAPGCPEKIDLQFLRYIWDFERVHAPQISAMIALHGAHIPVLVLKSYREGDALLALLGRAH